MARRGTAIAPTTSAGKTGKWLSHSQKTRNSQPRKPKIPRTSTMFRSIHPRCWERKLVSARNSKIHGIGVFANQSIAAGQILARYDGKILAAEEVQCELAAGNRYLLELPDGRVVDGSAGDAIHHPSGRWRPQQRRRHAAKCVGACTSFHNQFLNRPHCHRGAAVRYFQQ